MECGGRVLVSAAKEDPDTIGTLVSGGRRAPMLAANPKADALQSKAVSPATAGLPPHSIGRITLFQINGRSEFTGRIFIPSPRLQAHPLAFIRMGLVRVSFPPTLDLGKIGMALARKLSILCT